MIVGEVTGGQRQRLDDIDYTYPVLTVKDLKVWQGPIGYGLGLARDSAFPLVQARV